MAQISPFCDRSTNERSFWKKLQIHFSLTTANHSLPKIIIDVKSIDTNNYQHINDAKREFLV